MARSIRTRLIISFIILAIGPVLLLGFVTAFMGFNVLRNLTVTAQQQESSEISAQVSALLTDPIQRMQMLIHVDGLGAVDQSQQKSLIDELMNYDHSINELAVLDTAGQERIRITRRDVLGEADLRDQSQADEFKIPVQNGTIYFSSVQIDTATGEPLMTVAIPMFDLRSGALSGVFVGAVRFKPVWDLIANLSANRTDTVYIVDSVGRVVAHRDPSVVLKSTIFKVPGQAGESVGLDGSNVILAKKDMQFGSQVFSVVTEKPTSQAFDLAINQDIVTLIVMVLSLTGAITLGIVTVRRLVRPIQSLASTADAITAGDLARQADVVGEDEIGRMAKAFNSMTAQLRQSLEGLQRNVEELNKARQEQERQRAFLRQVIDAIPSIINTKNRDGQFTLVNEATARFHGSTVDDLLGKRIEELLPNREQAEQIMRADRQVLETKTPVLIREQLVVSAAGEARWNQTSKLPIIEPNGEMVQLLTVAMDITDRIKAEQAGEQTLSLQQAIFEASIDGILVADGRGTMVGMNRRFIEIWSIPDDIVAAKDDNRAIQHVLDQLVDPQAFVSKVTELYQAPEAESYDTLEFKDGRFFERYSIPQRLDNQIVGRVWNFRDITERKKAETERERMIKDLQAARRLAEENSRLKSEFLSTMSHELRTPLNAIEGFTGIILNKIGGTEFNEKTEGYLTRIRSNSKRLLQLINDFLDLSRIEAGRLELANQPFSPQRLAKRWQDEISVLAEKKGLNFEVSLDSTLPETAYGDEEAISKIALNLLGNAIKFTEQGQIKLGLERRDGTWGITVADTGIGIPPHAREFIFEEFRQVDQTSKRKYGGTGLGLAIVQKYVRAMGGSVTVASELGKGSTFTVSLPLKTTL